MHSDDRHPSRTLVRRRRRSHLDYYAAGGGYRVMWRNGEVPFVHERMRAGQMLAALRFANRVLDHETRLLQVDDMIIKAWEASL